jgi:hypothetical protein
VDPAIAALPAHDQLGFLEIEIRKAHAVDLDRPQALSGEERDQRPVAGNERRRTHALKERICILRRCMLT